MKAIGKVKIGTWYYPNSIQPWVKRNGYIYPSCLFLKGVYYTCPRSCLIGGVRHPRKLVKRWLSSLLFVVLYKYLVGNCLYANDTQAFVDVIRDFQLCGVVFGFTWANRRCNSIAHVLATHAWSFLFYCVAWKPP